MAGLLDAMNTYEGQQGLGLLAAAGPRFDGAGFFQRLQEGMGSADKWKRQQSAAELEKLQLEAEKAKIEDYKLKALQEKQALEQAAQKRSVLSSLFTPASQGAPAFNVDSALPPEFRAGLPTQPAISPRSAGIDPSKIPAALSVGVTAKDLAELDGLRNLGQNKVARTIEGQDDQSRPVTYQIDDLGNRVGQPIFKWEKPVEVGQGNQKSFVNPITGKTQFSLPVFQSPDSVASNQVSMRGQNMTDARARDLNAISREAAGVKLTEKEQEKQLGRQGQIASFDVMLGSLDRLANHPGLSRSVGMVGAFPTIPGSDSANFKAELDTFQSQAFLPMVSQLKGMGALSDAEGKKLTAAVGALHPSMGEKAFRESIARINKDMEASKERHVSISGGQPSTPKPMSDLPSASQNKGRVIRDTTTGKTLKSDGMVWKEQ